MYSYTLEHVTERYGVSSQMSILKNNLQLPQFMLMFCGESLCVAAPFLNIPVSCFKKNIYCPHFLDLFRRHLSDSLRDKRLKELNLCLDLELRVQKDNFATFMDEKQNQWTLGFDSLDVLVNLVKQFILCKTVFRLYFLTLFCI